MNAARRIVFVVYDGLQPLDLAGPAAAFSMANRLAGAPLYALSTLSPKGGAVACEGGFTLMAEPMAEWRVAPTDTVMVMGAEARPLRRALANRALIAWITAAADAAERVASVCTGAFALAATGLLDGRRATTHWEGCDALAASFPRVAVDRDALYIRDGAFWTSAGVTTGVDMALAMIREDHGAALMGRVAKRMVVYVHRPGRQSQFSGVLAAQRSDDGRYSDLIAWIDGALDQALTVEALAARAGQSERSFQRKFTAAIGLPPAKYVEKARIERAKRLLEAGALVKAVAAAVGFRSEAAFRARFHAHLGLSPAIHRLVHSDRSAR